MAGQFGFKSESVPGTAVTVDKFPPVTVARPGNGVPERIHRQGISARRVRKPPKKGLIKILPHVEMEVSNKNGTASWFKHMFGAVATTGAGPYTHTYTPASHLGDSLTAQFGITDATDTVRAFTVAGCKIDSWELSCAVGGTLMLSNDLVGMTVVTNVALASASVADDEAFTCVEATVSLAGSSYPAESFKLRCQKNLDKERHKLGSPTTLQPLEQGFFDFAGSIEGDFEDLTQYAAAVAGTQIAIVLAFTSAGAGAETLTLTMSGQLIGDPPELTTPGLESQTLNFELSHGTADASAITAVLVNSEASAA